MSDKQELFTRILQFKYDPEGFINYAFPWGQKGKDLAQFKGLRKWQLNEVKRIAKIVVSNKTKIASGVPSKVIYIAICSGRGNGKSAFLAMLNLWMMSCWFGTTMIVTANTETQLKTTTMAELRKWATLLINADWFECTALTIRPAPWFVILLKEQMKIDSTYYYIQAKPWNEDNTSAFAGPHSQRGMMVTFDEASGIDDKIWDVTEGFFSDISPMRLWIVISNPRKPTGRFFECFHRNKKRWLTTKIDVRTVEGIDLTFAERLIEDYGIDNDTVKTEVLGEFPSKGANALISPVHVNEAMTRPMPPWFYGSNHEPLILGVDVARFGDDKSVLYFRQGKDARSIPPEKYRGLDLEELADKVVFAIMKYHPDAVIIDGTGVGGGLCDILKRRGFIVIEVQFGTKSSNTDKWPLTRDEIWCKMADWTMKEVYLVDSISLKDDLSGPLYDIDVRGRKNIESKKSMKKRGLNSPDEGDALAITFTVDINNSRFQNRNKSNMIHAKMDYNIYGY